MNSVSEKRSEEGNGQKRAVEGMKRDRKELKKRNANRRMSNGDIERRYACLS